MLCGRTRDRVGGSRLNLANSGEATEFQLGGLQVQSGTDSIAESLDSVLGEDDLLDFYDGHALLGAHAATNLTSLDVERRVYHGVILVDIVWRDLSPPT